MGSQTQKYEIKRAQACHINTLKELEKDLFSDEWSAETWLGEINNNISEYVIMEVNEEIIGYAGVWLVAGEAQITRIAIVKKCQSKGFGKALLYEIIKRCKIEGAFAITLEVRESNEAAKKVYLDTGFKVQGVRHNYYQNHESAILMWKNLKEKSL